MVCMGTISARFLISLGFATFFLIGCGGSHPPIGVPGVMPQALEIPPGRTITHHIGSDSSPYQVLYTFGSGLDGKYPYADLIGVKGSLYSTTSEGGTYNEGTVFSITTNGSENVLYSFRRRPDSELPYASLLDVKGTLYGTTYSGGKHYKGAADQGGAVFSMSMAGKEDVMHDFGGGSDGQASQARLIDVKGTLYGTTVYGGKYGYGTVFSITTEGKETRSTARRYMAARMNAAAPTAGRSSASPRAARRKCCIASATEPTAHFPWPA
jgi:uncharacterized repeat protein (TIGR03803 family)